MEQIQPLSTYSVFGEKKVSLKHEKSLKLCKTPDFGKWSGFPIENKVTGMYPQDERKRSGATRTPKTAVPGWTAPLRIPKLQPQKNCHYPLKLSSVTV